MISIIIFEFIIILLLINHVLAFPFPFLMRHLTSSIYDFVPLFAALGGGLLPL